MRCKWSKKRWTRARKEFYRCARAGGCVAGTSSTRTCQNPRYFLRVRLDSKVDETPNRLRMRYSGCRGTRILRDSTSCSKRSYLLAHKHSFFGTLSTFSEFRRSFTTLPWSALETEAWIIRGGAADDVSPLHHFDYAALSIRTCAQSISEVPQSLFVKGKKYSTWIDRVTTHSVSSSPYLLGLYLVWYGLLVIMIIW